MRFQPAMKGIPEETFEAEFKITIKPILINKGNLSLSISTYDKKENLYSIFIDGISYPQGTKTLFLDTGMHTLNIQSEFYRNETRSIYIEQAKDTQIEIKLQSLDPMLKITAPANTKIFIDDTNIASVLCAIPLPPALSCYATLTVTWHRYFVTGKKFVA